MVAPDLQGEGLGRWMLERIEEAAPEGATGFVLFTGAGSTRNLRMYRKAGYRPAGERSGACRGAEASRSTHAANDRRGRDSVAGQQSG